MSTCMGTARLDVCVGVGVDVLWLRWDHVFMGPQKVAHPIPSRLVKHTSRGGARILETGGGGESEW